MARSSGIEKFEQRLGALEAPLSLERRFAGRRGLYLVYDFPPEVYPSPEDVLVRARAARAVASHPACRALELVDEFAQEDDELPLLFNDEYRFALALPAQPSGRRCRRLLGLVEDIAAATQEEPAPYQRVKLPRRPHLPVEVETDWRWQLEQVDKITDALGCTVDRGIREPVASLLMSGFPTGMSCEGHLDRGQRTPWISIEKNPERYRSGSPSEAQLRRRVLLANRRLAQRLHLIVGEFNRTRPELPAWQKLIVTEPEGELGGRLSIYGGCRFYDQNWPDRQQLLLEMRREFRAFARHLQAQLPSLRYWLWRFDY